MGEENINALAAWANGQKIPIIVQVYFNQEIRPGFPDKWRVRLYPEFQKERSIRTLSGENLDELCRDILPLVKDQWEKMGQFFIKQHQQRDKHHRKQVRREFAEIERMHMGAEDF